MPRLPDPPELTQAQYDHVAGVFTRIAAREGHAGPIEAFNAMFIDWLITVIRTDAYRDINEQMEARRAEVDALLANLIAGEPMPTEPEPPAEPPTETEPEPPA
jgi:hypothetical protein